MKYAIVTINHKGLSPRRILIEYQHLEANSERRIYTKVRVVKKDPYFSSSNTTYKYIFNSDSMDAMYVAADAMTKKLRKEYYSLVSPDWLRDENVYKLYAPNEFECDDDESAILRFEI